MIGIIAATPAKFTFSLAEGEFHIDSSAQLWRLLGNRDELGEEDRRGARAARWSVPVMAGQRDEAASRRGALGRRKMGRAVPHLTPFVPERDTGSSLKTTSQGTCRSLRNHRVAFGSRKTGRNFPII